MRRRWLLVAARAALLCLVAHAVLPCWAAHAGASTRLIFGSFELRSNADRWAVEVTERTGLATEVIESSNRFRVASAVLSDAQTVDAIAAARREALDYWRTDADAGASEPNTAGQPFPVPPADPHTGLSAAEPALVEEEVESTSALVAPNAAPPPTPDAPTNTVPHPLTGARLPDRAEVRPDLNERISAMDLDLGFQTRSYAERGFDGQSRFQPSVSALYHYRASWNDSDYVTFAPFARLDAEDDERTHADLRELYWSHVGEDWDLHVGIRQVFWGVTEFKHLVDVINQTDLVEDIDGEEKLGQPMVNLSTVHDWGIVDFFLLPGFRERTFPGEDGRLRYAFPVDEDGASYESGDEKHHVDGAIRWSHVLGPFEFAVYQFSGTSREPKLIPAIAPDGETVLRPSYELIDQTGLDGQAILGDWALKLEALSSSGYGERYGSVVAGFERTFVGVWGGRTDLGLVAEYMYDERGDDAWDTVLERDVAVGTRFRLNDVADSTALFGVIWDTETDEYLITLEASRRLGDSWALWLEGRVFGGADDAPRAGDADAKTAYLQRDDYIQLEVMRFF